VIPRRAAAVFVCLFLVVSCGLSAREKAIATSLTALNTARDGFAAYSEARQLRIVAEASTREAGEEALKMWRTKREPVVQALLLAYAALAEAAVGGALDKALAEVAKVRELLRGLP
jgi:hypothetical protein